MKIVLRLALLAALVITSLARAAEAPAFTAKECAQGYRDQIVLAKPRAELRARVDAEEAGARLRVRGKLSRLGDLRVVEIEGGETPVTAIARLQATGLYEFVEPDYIFHSDATPNDPSYPTQWALNNTGQLTGSTPGDDIKAPAAWNILHDAPNVVVALIDGGVRIDHADLSPNLWVNPQPTFGDINGARFVAGVRSGDVTDEGGHGTHVAGIMGATGNNGVGIAGVAWRVQLMVLKNSGADGASAASDSAACLDYAVAHGAKLVNCSFGGAVFSQTLFTAIKAARDAGVIVVTSAGNNGLSVDTSPHYPSNYLLDNIVAVGNSTPVDSASSSSDYGALVELFAPGTSIRSLDYATTTGTIVYSGTSMAAPHVTGALALLKAQFPADTYLQLINRLLRGTDLKVSLAGRAVTTGRLNLFGALTTTTNRPFNDDYPTRAVITGNSITVRANNRGATTETGEPVHAGVVSTGSLWWEWVASRTGVITIDTSGSDFDTVLAVYSGSSLAALTPIVANDNDGAKQTSLVTCRVTTGSSYSIAVAGKAGAQGFIQLNLVEAPANDNFADAITLSGQSTQVSGTTLNATLEPGEAALFDSAGGASVWYRWTAPRTGRFQISAFTTTFDTLLGIYTGGGLVPLTLVASNDNTGYALNNTDSRCTINAIADTVYYLKVDAKSPSGAGDFTLSITDSLWQASTKGPITGAPAIGADGTLYFGGGFPDFKVYAVAPDGSLKWSYAANESFDNCSPAIGGDGTIYFGCYDGTVTAFAPEGTVLWQRNLNAGYTNDSPALAPDGTLFLHADDGFLYALDSKSGATKWRYDVGVHTFASPAIAPDGTIYQASDDKHLYALRPDGTLKWQFATDGTTYSAPAIDGVGNIYFTTYESSKLWSVTPAGAQRWSYAATTGSATSASPTLSADGSTVYFGDGAGFFHAVNSADGTRQWRFTLGDSVYSSTAAVDSKGVIYVGAYDGKLYALNANGTLKRTWDTGQKIRSSPAIFGATLYVGSNDEKLYAFDIGATAASGPWPQYRQNVCRVGRMVPAPVIARQPTNQSPNAGTDVTWMVAANGSATYQWQLNGLSLPGATSAGLTVAGIQPFNTGLYTVVATSDGSVTSDAAIIGVTTASAVIGEGKMLATHIQHPNLNYYDQVQLTGAAEAITTPGYTVRTSFIDLNDDIVQVEFAGAGTLSLALDNATGPALPVNYNQAASYMKGHAGIVITGADETTNVSVFSVGRVNAFDPTGGFNFLQAISATNNPANNGSALFAGHATTAYDGVADIAFIAISSANGKFGGLRASDASCFATKGLTGIYAPGVQFTGPVFICDISAAGTATPVFIIGSSSDTRITGGDLQQANGQPVKVSGLKQLKFTPGGTSNNVLLPAQANKAVLQQNGVDVTAQIVVNPVP